MAKKGRPAGALNLDRPIVVTLPPACPACLGTESESLRIVTEQAIAGTIDGHVYTHVVWRNVRCKLCGQHFRVRSYEYRQVTDDSTDRAA